MQGIGSRQELIVYAVVLGLTLCILRFFLLPLAWAFVIALATWPLYRRFAARMPRRFAPNVVALIFTGLIALFVLAPFGFAFLSIGEQVRVWAHEVALADQQGVAAPQWLPAVPLAGSWLVNQWDVVLGTPGGVTGLLQRTDSGSVITWAGSLGGFILHHTWIIVFTVLALFFLYRGGEPLAEHTLHVINRKLGPRGDRYFRQAALSIRATVGGMLLVSLFDGVLVGAAYALAGVPSVQVWAAVTGLSALIPFASYVAIAGAALVLFAKGAGAAAAGVLAWGVLVVFVADKLIRPALLANTTGLGFFWTLVGSLGGVAAFGLLGLFVGPAILTLAAIIWRESIDDGTETAEV